MAHVVVKKNGKPLNSPWVFTQAEIDNLRRNAGGDCFTVVNVITRRTSRVGACSKRRKKGLGRSRRRR